MVEFAGIQNVEYVAAVAVVIVLIVWYLIKHSQQGRLGLERRELQEDKQLRKMDERIIVDIKQERNDALELGGLFSRLNSRAFDIHIDVFRENVKLNFDYIKTALDILSRGDKSLLVDKVKVGELFQAIDTYLNVFSGSNDTWIATYIRQIRNLQGKLFKVIIEQDKLLREKFALLRREEQETVAEEGSFDKAA